jgi:hypothetical protein
MPVATELGGRRRAFSVWLHLGIAVLVTVAAPHLRSQQQQQLPDAATVAGKIGENVIFEDSIKAVSKSRTHNGCYFSFGAPFPQQVLSVWIPMNVFDMLAAPPLIGRTVRIAGLLHQSPTGPMVDLDSPEQYQLLPLDEAILSKLHLDGKTDRNHFMTAVRQDFERDEFDTLETLSQELHQSHERFSDGTWILPAYFDAFHVTNTSSDETYASTAQRLARWTARYPNSNAALLIKAGLHLDLAYKWRSGGSARKITRATRAHAREELATARQILEGNTWAKASPDYYVKMQRVALHQHWSKDDYFRLFAEAIGRERDYYTFYFSAAEYLLGTRGAWERFAEEQRQKRGGPEGDILYARIAWAVSSVYSNIFRESAVSWETMAAGFEDLMRQYPDSVYLKNVYGHFAFRARDRARLRAALPAVRAAPDMAIWVNLENVGFAEAFARSEPGDDNHWSPGTLPVKKPGKN